MRGESACFLRYARANRSFQPQITARGDRRAARTSQKHDVLEHIVLLGRIARIKNFRASIAPKKCDAPGHIVLLGRSPDHAASRTPPRSRAAGGSTAAGRPLDRQRAGPRPRSGQAAPPTVPRAAPLPAAAPRAASPPQAGPLGRQRTPIPTAPRPTPPAPTARGPRLLRGTFPGAVTRGRPRRAGDCARSSAKSLGRSPPRRGPRCG